MTEYKTEALHWFLAGFAASGEGYNPDVLTDWDDEDHPLRETFEEQYPDPEYEDAVTTAEERAAFARKVEREGLLGAISMVPQEGYTTEYTTIKTPTAVRPSPESSEPDYDELLIGVPEDSPYGEGDEECPNCGETFDDDAWEYTHGGDAWGGSAWYVCPECGEQSVTVLY